MEKSTPPMGEPKATATPAALDAVRISRILTEGQRGHLMRLTGHSLWLSRYRGNSRATTLPTAHATWTEGPSLPTARPDPIASGCGQQRLTATHQGQGLEDERLEPKISLDNEPAEDALDLRDARARGIRRKAAHEVRGREREGGLRSAQHTRVELTAYTT